MKLDAKIFDADLNENRCKFARQPPESASPELTWLQPSTTKSQPKGQQDPTTH